MKRGAWWPIAVVAVLLVTVVANVLLLRAASAPNASVTEPDYYRKAVAWDSSLTAERRSAATGWSAAATLARTAQGLEVRVDLRDAHGAPLTGALVRVTAIHNLESGHPGTLTLAPGAAGVYAAPMASTRAGLWELRVTATRGAEHFGADLRCEAAPAGAPS